MKKLLMLCLALVVMVGLSFAGGDKKKKGAKSGESAKAVTVTGWVGDTMCAAGGKKAGHEECGKKCVEKGAKVALISGDDKVWTVENPAKLDGHMGHHVQVTGHPNAEKMTIHIEDVKMLGSSDKAKSDKAKS